MTQRCSWCGAEPLYVAYHDEEWGVPERDDEALFEKLILDGFQAGLSWWIILKKREAFRRAFDDFQPERIAAYAPAKIAELEGNAAIVRNRAKIRAAVTSAQAFLDLRAAGVSFADYLWDFVDGTPLQNRFRQLGELPAETPLSRTIAKDLKARGFRFCGPTITYAFMQAVGMVNDHLTSCFRHDQVTAMAAPGSPTSAGSRRA